MKDIVLHFYVAGSIACNRNIPIVNSVWTANGYSFTDHIEEVTCLNCKHTRWYRNAGGLPPVKPVRCSVCGGEPPEHDWEIHVTEMRAASY